MSDTRGPDDARPGSGGSPGDAPALVSELAEACRGYVERAVGIALDYRPETLPLLDHYVAGARREMADRPGLALLIGRVVGAYFGEVACREAGVFWHVPSEDVYGWRLLGRRVYLAVNPVAVAYDALYATVDHDGPSSEIRVAPEEREGVERRLESLPAVSESEYYLLSTRLEVLEIAIEALRGAMLDNGTADVEFDLSDYLGDSRML